ncbi:DUF6223 family protein [Nakamurella sp. GG22]
MVAFLIAFLALASPAAADTALQQADTSAYTLTAGRLWSLVAAAVGLIGLVTGGAARARILGGPRTQRRKAILALVAGLAGSVIGGTVVLFADGGPGSGSGIVGGLLAVLIGLLAMAVGGRVLKRSHRADQPVGITSRA